LESVTIAEERVGRPKETRSKVRITPTYFFLLLGLVDGSRHGYALAKEARERSDGAVDLGPGSLYWSLNRLSELGLIEETDVLGEEAGDERRRYYCLTDPGREVLKQELGTLAKVVDFARAKRVV
jgi:DNA-binding PadR family transcriptional regulator